MPSRPTADASAQVRGLTTPAVWLRGPMTVIGFHCSHEQIAPGTLLRDVQHAEQAGFTAAMSSDHLSPWSERQGESGFAWSFLGAALATTDLPFGVVDRPRPALPPRHHGAGHRDPGEHVPRPLLGGARLRRGQQRAGHRRRLAAQGRPRRPPGRVRRRHPPPARRRGGRPRRPRHRQPRPPVDPPGCRATPGRPGRHPRDRSPPRRLGRRPGHRQPAARHPAPGARRLPRRRRPRSRPPPGAPQLGADRRRGPRDRPRPVAQQRPRPTGLLGHRDRRGLRRRWRRP